MKNKMILHNKNIIAYICLVNVLINVKTKMNCKTEKLFFIYVQHGGPHLYSTPGRGLRTTGLEPILCIFTGDPVVPGSSGRSVPRL